MVKIQSLFLDDGAFFICRLEGTLIGATIPLTTGPFPVALLVMAYVVLFGIGTVLRTTLLNLAYASTKLCLRVFAPGLNLC